MLTQRCLLKVNYLLKHKLKEFVEIFKKKKSSLFSIGNQTVNRNIKNARKKQKKATKRSERKVNDVADVLENVTLDNMDYDFKTDFD